MSILRIVAYDIPSDRTRVRVAHLLEGYGVRVQGSVFECWLEESHLRRLRARLEKLLDPACDKVRIYSLCGRDTNDRQCAAGDRVTTDESLAIV